jgi:hypothetical protein
MNDTYAGGQVSQSSENSSEALSTFYLIHISISFFIVKTNFMQNFIL